MAVTVSKTGGIYIEISGDYSKLQADLKQVDAIAKATGKDISAAMSGALSPAAASRSANELSKYFATARRAAVATKADLSGMEKQFRDMGKAIGVAEKDLGKFVNLQKQMYQNQAARSFENNLKGIQRLTGASTSEMIKLRASLGDNAGALKLMGAEASAAFGKIANLRNIIMAGAAAMAFNKFADLTSEYTDLESRLRNVTSSADEANMAMARIKETADRTYAAIGSTSEIFLQNALAFKDLGLSTKQQLDFMESMTSALIVSGAKGQQAESVIRALSKAMMEGKLKGDNWNTVLQQGGRVVQALADGLGVSIAQLREMGSQGELTSQMVFRALISQMEKLNKEAEAMPATINDAFVKLRNQIFSTVGEIDKMQGTSERVVASIDRITGTIKENQQTIAALIEGAAWLAEKTIALIGWTTRFIQKSTLGYATLIDTVIAYGKAIKDIISGKSISEANNTLNQELKNIDDTFRSLYSEIDGKLNPALNDTDDASENASKGVKSAADASVRMERAAREAARASKELAEAMALVGGAGAQMGTSVENNLKVLQNYTKQARSAQIASENQGRHEAEVAYMNLQARIQSLTDQAQKMAEQGFTDASQTMLEEVRVLNIELDRQKKLMTEIASVPYGVNFSGVSSNVQKMTESAIKQGIGYKLGARDISSGKIDCSGWIITMNADNQVVKRGGTSAGIIKEVSEMAGELLTGLDLTPERITEGILIGLDTGVHKWEGAGRFKGIDHVVQTYLDAKTGKMMVSESNGAQGVAATPYDKWYARQTSLGRQMYGASLGGTMTGLAPKNSTLNSELAENRAAKYAEDQYTRARDAAEQLRLKNEQLAASLNGDSLAANLKKAQAEYQKQIAAIDKENGDMMAKLDELRKKGTLTPETQKYIEQAMQENEARKQLLETERAYNEEIAKRASLESTLGFRINETDLLREKVEALTAAYQDGYLSLEQYNIRLAQTGLEMANLMQMQGLSTWTEDLNLALGQVTEGYQGLAAGLSESFGNFFTSFNQGVADSIGRAVVESENLDDALHNVAKSITSGLISSLVQLGMQYVVNAALGQSVAAASMAASTAAGVATASALASAYAPAAAAASLASYGANAAPAMAGMTATYGLAQGLSAATGFKDGGYTGNIDPNTVAGVVHGGEYVFDADSVKRIGLSSLEGLQAGASGPRPAGAMGDGLFSPPATTMNVTVKNYGPQMDFQVNQLSATDIEIIATRVADQRIREDVPGLVSSGIRNPNSLISKSLAGSTTTERRRKN